MYAIINDKRYIYNIQDQTIGVMILENNEWNVKCYSVKNDNKITIEMDDSVADYEEINRNIRSIYNGDINMIE